MIMSVWTMPNSDLGGDLGWKPLHTIPKRKGKRPNPNAAKQKAAKRARKTTRRKP